MEGSTFTSMRAEVIGNFGVVSATHGIPAQVAMGVLERGGNAFDAAVAAGLVFHIVDPDMAGFGGELVALVKRADEAEPMVLCAQGTAPAHATIAHYQAEGFDLIPGVGVMAAVVPGAFDGWMLLLRDYGTMDLATIFEASLNYAAGGFPLTANAAKHLRRYVSNMRQWRATAETYLLEGGPPTPGQIIINRPLANCLNRIVTEATARGTGREQQIETAREIYYGGFVAETIDTFIRGYREPDSSSDRLHQGLLTADDMAHWRASFERPLWYDYDGARVFKPHAWAQGAVLLQTLAILGDLRLDGADMLNADAVHLQAEALKLAFADREAWYGDPKFIDVPMRHLLSDEYNTLRRSEIAPTAALDLRPGNVPGRQPVLPRYDTGEVGTAVEPAAAVSHEKDTCHLNIIDRWRNVVSATPSGGWVQDSPLIPDLGFSLSTRGQMFWLQDGLPSSLAPGRRPRTTLTPTMATLRDGSVLTFGCRGADHSEQGLLQFLLRVLHTQMDLQTAIETPVFASEHWPSSTYPRRAMPGRLLLGRSFGESVATQLRSRGHEVQVKPDEALGRTCVAADRGKLMHAAATGRLGVFVAVGR